MFQALTNAVDREAFTRVLSHVRHAYWPEDEYRACHEELPRWSIRPKPMDRLREINERLQEITGHICERGLYKIVVDPGREPVGGETYILPFMERFHEYFLVRQWNEPIRDPVEDYEDIVMLAEPESEQEKRRNYSKNERDYNHFVNVVAACARLIQYFGDRERLAGMPLLKGLPANDRSYFLDRFAYGSGSPDEEHRKFMLILAAFYHDLGKTVVYHRHAMEGSMIIAGHPTTSLYHLGRITRAKFGMDLTREDLLFVGDLINHHDQFGTLSTGETGYVRLAGIVDGIKRYGKRTAGRNARNCQLLFDLWILNVADISVSIRDKGVIQSEWFDPAEAVHRIEGFLHLPQWESLAHDLEIAISLLIAHERFEHSSNTLELQQEALRYSSRHVVERIRRLLVASVRSIHIPRITPANGWDSLAWDAIVYRNIESLSDVTEFSRRLSLIGQMDYSLGFFKKIAQRAAWHVGQEAGLQPGEKRTGWIHASQKGGGEVVTHDAGFLDGINASFFADNFASTVIQIIDFLLFREKDVDQVRNFEFIEASTRLTEEKIDKILTLEGPYRSQKTIEQILKTIFIY